MWTAFGCESILLELSHEQSALLFRDLHRVLVRAYAKEDLLGHGTRKSIRKKSQGLANLYLASRTRPSRHGYSREHEILGSRVASIPSLVFCGNRLVGLRTSCS